MTFTSDVAVSNSQANVVVTHRRGHRSALAASFFTAGALTKIGVVAQTVDEIVAGINANAFLRIR